jgi:hypothetical protein
MCAYSMHNVSSLASLSCCSGEALPVWPAGRGPPTPPSVYPRTQSRYSTTGKASSRKVDVRGNRLRQPLAGVPECSDLSEAMLQ